MQKNQNSVEDRSSKTISRKPDLKLIASLSKYFSVIPLKPRSKKPEENGWTKYCRARRIFRKKDFLGNRNAGICCGPGSGVLGLDVDDRKLFEALCKANGWKIPDTFQVRTGSFGSHFYFQYPDDGQEYGNKSFSHPIYKRTGIFDIRGTGGMLVSPGSIHPSSGRRYKIVSKKKPAPCPQYLLDFIKGKAINADALLGIPLAKPAYREFIRGLKIPEGRKRGILAKSAKGKRSEKIFGVINSLLNGGCDDKTIKFIFDHYPIGQKYREKGRGKVKWLMDEIARAKSKTSESSGGGELDIDDLVDHFEKNVLGSTDFLKMKFPKPVMFFEPWLSEGSNHMIYGPTGIGKSTLAQIVAVLLTTLKKKGVDLPGIGPWNLIRTAPVFLLDAETGEADLQNRLKELRYPLGKASKKYPRGIYTVSHAAKKTGLQLNLTNEVWREALYRFLKYKVPGYRVLILDNLVTLTPGIDENKKQDWDPINQWLLRLKHLGISSIIIHHSGVKKHQRGTTSRQDTLDSIINLSESEGYDISEGAHFLVKFEKTRNIPPGSNLRPFTLKLVKHPVRGLTWETEKPKAKPENDQIIALLLDGKLKQKEIASKVGVSEMTVTNVKKEAIKGKLMDKKREPTEAGEKFLKTCGLDLSAFYEEE